MASEYIENQIKERGLEPREPTEADEFMVSHAVVSFMWQLLETNEQVRNDRVLTQTIQSLLLGATKAPKQVWKDLARSIIRTWSVVEGMTEDELLPTVDDQIGMGKDSYVTKTPEGMLFVREGKGEGKAKA